MLGPGGHLLGSPVAMQSRCACIHVHMRVAGGGREEVPAQTIASKGSMVLGSAAAGAAMFATGTPALV